MTRADFLKWMGMGAGWMAVGAPVRAITEPVPLVGETELNAHFVHRGPGFGNRVALTYDDGPSPGVTERILEELAKRDLTATFFMIGSKVKSYPSLAREVAAAGHELANHTYTHPALSKLNSTRVVEEITKCQEIIGEVTGKSPVWFRPPYGAFRRNQGYMPRNEDLGVAYWSVDPKDWARPGASAIVNHVTSRAHAGSIILLHDLHRQTAEATPAVLDGLLEKDFFLAPMSGFLGDPYGSYAVTEL